MDISRVNSAMVSSMVPITCNNASACFLLNGVNRGRLILSTVRATSSNACAQGPACGLGQIIVP